MFFRSYFRQGLPSQTTFTVLACRGFWKTRVIHGCGRCRKSGLLRHSLTQLGPWRFFSVLLVHITESERGFQLETETAEIWYGESRLHGVKAQICVHRSSSVVLEQRSATADDVWNQERRRSWTGRHQRAHVACAEHHAESREPTVPKIMPKREDRETIKGKV